MDFIDLIKCLCLLALFAFAPVKLFVRALKARRAAERELEGELAKPRCVTARVGEKNAGISYNLSVRYPEHKREFLVNFILSNGSQKEFFVSKEVFDSLKLGKKGKLTFCGDSFIDFE